MSSGIDSFWTIFEEGMPERLAPNDWLKKWTHAGKDAGADFRRAVAQTTVRTLFVALRPPRCDLALGKSFRICATGGGRGLAMRRALNVID
jgi:hypothetical protein